MDGFYPSVAQRELRCRVRHCVGGCRSRVFYPDGSPRTDASRVGRIRCAGQHCTDSSELAAGGQGLTCKRCNRKAERKFGGSIAAHPHGQPVGDDPGRRHFDGAALGLLVRARSLWIRATGQSAMGPRRTTGVCGAVHRAGAIGTVLSRSGNGCLRGEWQPCRQSLCGSSTSLGQTIGRD